MGGGAVSAAPYGQWQSLKLGGLPSPPFLNVLLIINLDSFFKYEAVITVSSVQEQIHPFDIDSFGGKCFSFELFSSRKAFRKLENRGFTLFKLIILLLMFCF